MTLASGPRVLIATGEMSGDLAAVRLVNALRRRVPDAEFIGIGGRHLQACGVRLACDASTLGVVGITEVMAAAPSLVPVIRAVRRLLHTARPAVGVLVGNDLFNVGLARWLRAWGIPAVAYFPPQVWVWGALAGPIVRSFDAVFASFPEEYAVYARAARGTSARVSDVGHYLADEVTPPTAEDRQSARIRLDVGDAEHVITLLPGSRRREVDRLAPVLFEAALLLLARDPRLRFVVPIADRQHTPAIERAMAVDGLSRRVVLTFDSETAMTAADLLVTSSGTATLEAALRRIPMVVTYRVSPVTHWVIRLLLRAGLLPSYTTGLPNLIAGRAIVPELLQSQATPSAIARETWALLTEPGRLVAMRDALDRVRLALPPQCAIERVADCVLDLARAGRNGGAP